jgi:hypothetical protein
MQVRLTLCDKTNCIAEECDTEKTMEAKTRKKRTLLPVEFMLSPPFLILSVKDLGVSQISPPPLVKGPKIRIWFFEKKP